jgi:hypothetical protein
MRTAYRRAVTMQRQRAREEQDTVGNVALHALKEEQAAEETTMLMAIRRMPSSSGMRPVSLNDPLFPAKRSWPPTTNSMI